MIARFWSGAKSQALVVDSLFKRHIWGTHALGARWVLDGKLSVQSHLCSPRPRSRFDLLQGKTVEDGSFFTRTLAYALRAVSGSFAPVSGGSLARQRTGLHRPSPSHLPMADSLERSECGAHSRSVHGNGGRHPCGRS
jgi:hypothetical protein